MAYTQLIKNFERIRDYMREFYVYGFKSREEYNKKSVRSYDNERRRIESYLGEYMSFHQSEKGKNVFLSIDSRSVSHNPLYNALKAKSFTDGDITLHFILFDILHSPDVALSLSEITDKIDSEYLSCFNEPMVFDESTVRKKLKEYTELGLIVCKKDGKKTLYSRTADTDISDLCDLLSFFSEAGLCGAAGSFLLDKFSFTDDYFSFKHHYITHALESEILYKIFDAMSQKRTLTVTSTSRRSENAQTEEIVPLKVLISVQNGRRYLAGYVLNSKYYKTYRLDYMNSIKAGEVYADFDKKREYFSLIQKNMWGVVCDERRALEHVEFTVHIGRNEEYIYKRLLREKRCGTVERIDENTCKFSAFVYDSSELNPWIRTFIGRIESINYSDKHYENRFNMDLQDMYRLYGIGGEE
ncbi:MAG: WYL domain-containing protein [Clostridia bacterium]|nr:WYL domain-containing protein [Clostridia bacterium]